MKVKAYAKVNLCLDVIRRKENGYHDLEMIMVPIDFYDVIDIEVSKEMKLESSAGFLPVDSRNTMVKAIELLREAYQFKENFCIYLTKHIPTQAGLAGGSTDAASVIVAVNNLLKLNMSQEEMMAIGKKVGSDVPFFIIHEAAVVKGEGEIIEPFTINTDFYLLLVKPRKGVSTKLAFEGLDFNKALHPNVKQMKDDLIQNNYQNFIQGLVNTLEEPSIRLVPEIKKIKDDLIKFGMDGCLMSGSGSTVFAVTRSKATMQKANDVLRKKGHFVRMTRILKEKKNT
ncbi:MAG: 4-(cytidine 5'-diphospho)-2-C-methyl-D-erythritol kinase [Erysipelotrichaceae bacterium]